MRGNIQTDPDVAKTAAMIADPSRAAILIALSDGRALPAGELARRARISPQTASAHLDKLFRSHFLAVEIQGRHRYYRLRSAQVASILESLSIVAPAAPAMGPVQNGVAQELRFARVCYDHLAGKLGVMVTQTLCELGYINNDEAGFLLTGKGRNWFHGFGIDVVELRTSRRPLTRRCFDWSERRAHLAGALGAALIRRFLALHLIVRAPAGRAVRLTNKGRAGFRARLSLDLATAILP
jgi:DNA-binding transcriptional ArsR family regulator